MKKKLRNYFKLGTLLLGISLGLIYCKEDPIPLEETHVHYDSPYSITRIDCDEIQQNVLLTSNLEDLDIAIQKAQTRSKSGSDEPDVYDFTIDTESANYIENKEGTYHSYTFAIKRDYDYGYLENLLLAYDEIEGYKAYLIKYDFTFAEKEAFFKGDELDLNGKVKTIELDISDLNIDFRLKQYTCVEIYREWCLSHKMWADAQAHDELECSGVYHVASQNEVIGWDCYDRQPPGGGSGGTSDGGGTGDTDEGDMGDDTGNGGTGTGDGSDDPDVTTPTECRRDCPPELEEELSEKSPCAQLTILNNTEIVSEDGSTVKDLFNKLRNNTNLNKETGYFLTPTTENEDTFEADYFESKENEDEVSINLGANIISCLMHVHYNTDTKNQLSVFSLQDLETTFNLIKEEKVSNSSTFTSVLITESGTNYALKITNVQQFLNFGNVFFAGWEFSNVKDAREKLYKNDYGISPENNNDISEKGFAEFLTKQDLGCTLFKSDASFTQWSTVVYSDGETNTVPCK